MQDVHGDYKCTAVQVPVLYDKQTKTIVSNESADIIRMFVTECQVSRVIHRHLHPSTACVSCLHCMQTLT